MYVLKTEVIEVVRRMNVEMAISESLKRESYDVAQYLKEVFPQRVSFVLRCGGCFCGCCNDERLHQSVVVLKECGSL